MNIFLVNVLGHSDDHAVNDVVSNLFNIVTIEKDDAVKIVGGAILINGKIETVSADTTRVIVESVDIDIHDVPQIRQMDINVVGGNTYKYCTN